MVYLAEELCALTAIDSFMLEHDQLPNFQATDWMWNLGNVLIDPDGHAVAIDNAVLHNRRPVPDLNGFHLAGQYNQVWPFGFLSRINI